MYTCNNLCTYQVTDWLPTLLHAAGYDISTLPSNIDGIDQWDSLKNGKQEGVSRDSYINDVLLNIIKTLHNNFVSDIK